MKKLVLTFLLGVLLLPQTSFADDAAKRQLAEELLTLHHAREVAEQSANQLNQMLLIQLGAADLASVDPEGFKELHKQTGELVANEFNWEKVKAEYVDLYLTAFSEDELRAIVDFSNSPAGRKLQEVNPKMVESSRGIGQRHTAAVLPPVQKLVEAFMTAHQKQEDEKTPAAAAPAPK